MIKIWDELSNDWNTYLNEPISKGIITLNTLTFYENKWNCNKEQARDRLICVLDS